MSISAILKPWHVVAARPQPDPTAPETVDQKPVLVVQPVPDNPTAHIMPQWAGLPAKAALPVTKVASNAPMPDLHFPDPLPDLPKIDPPAPKADYPAALGILSGSTAG
jgi:hypothetical protein